MSASLVSARSFAASLWEQYTLQRLENPECYQNQHSSYPQAHLVPPPKNAVCPSTSPLYRKIPEPLAQTTERTDGNNESCMTSSQMGTSGILANVVHRMKFLEETQSQHAAVLHKLKLDSQIVASRVQELEFSLKSALKEIHYSLRTSGEQMAITRRKEREKARLALLHLQQEMEEERTASRLLKEQNQKLAKDLMNADLAAADASEEMKRERKARELLEQVCNELAREIGDDKAEMEQLKEEQEKCRKRFEEELKMMKMDALWQDERMKERVAEAKSGRDEGDRTQGIPLNELRRKLQAFVEAAGVCTHKEEKQAEQARILMQALQLLEVVPSSDWEEANENVELRAGAACSNASSLNREGVCKITGSMRNRNGSCNNPFSKETETGSGVEEQRMSSVNGKRTSRKLRALMQARRQQRRDGLADEKSFHFWEKHANAAWTSSGDEPDGRQQVASGRAPIHDLPHAGRGPGLGKASIGRLRAKDSRSVEQSPSIANHQHGTEGHGREGGGKLEPDSGDGDDAVSCERVRNGGTLVGETDGNKPNIITSEPADLSHAGNGDEAQVANALNCNCAGQVNKCSHGCNDLDKGNENADHVALHKLKKINVRASSSGIDESMRKMSPWRPASAKSLSLPRFWSPMQNASIFGGASKHGSRACSFVSPQNGQGEENRHSITASSTHLGGHSIIMEDMIAKEPADPPSLTSLKDNSLGAQLLKARALESETKPAKPSLRFSPRRRRRRSVSYG